MGIGDWFGGGRCIIDTARAVVVMVVVTMLVFGGGDDYGDGISCPEVHSP